MANEVAKPTNTLKSLLTSDAVKKQIALALPKHMDADRMARVALTALLKTPKLTQCSQESFMQCVLSCSQLGIEPDGRLAHLIPYGKDCTLIIDYKGLVALARRSGTVANIHADVVCENDDFEYDCGQIVRHKVNFRQPRGDVFAVYVQVVFKDGTKQCEVMSREDVEAIRARSKSKNSGPWVTDWNEMAKKTAFRRLSKWLELSPEYRRAIDVDDDPHISGDVIDTTVTRHSAGTQQLNALLTELPDNAEDDGADPVSKAAAFESRISTASSSEELESLFQAIDQSVAAGELSAEEESDLLHKANKRLEAISQ